MLGSDVRIVPAGYAVLVTHVITYKVNKVTIIYIPS